MEKILMVPISEVTTFRVRCNQCKTSTDIQLGRLGTASLMCPGCKEQLRRPDIDKTITDLASAITYLQQQDRFEFQLVLSEKL